jgi:sRNA-binding carbon storage regulator CsrA
MLAITRRPQQKFMITTPSGEIITIQVIRTRTSDTTIGIEAPKNFYVDRGEIHEQYKEIRKVLKEQGTLE